MAHATYRDQPLRIALIGMSGAGKTFWTKKLAENGRPTLSCDDRIAQRLRTRWALAGSAGTQGVAAWMGWPDSPTYLEREAAYLAEEIHTLDEILEGLAKRREEPLVLDTTGSVIYTGNHLLMRLRREMTVVYLAASPAEQLLLIERYLKDPKPVLWRGAFRSQEGETPQKTVERCYPVLMAARRQSYEALAHCTLPLAELRTPPTGRALGAEEFLERIRARLG